MMTETRVEIRFEEGCSAVLNNHYLADMQYQAMQLIGPIDFTQEEIDFAQAINDAFPGHELRLYRQCHRILQTAARDRCRS